MGWFSLTCAKCGWVTLAADATITDCCNMKLCDAKCFREWKAQLYEKSKCPECGRRFNKESDTFFPAGK